MPIRRTTGIAIIQASGIRIMKTPIPIRGTDMQTERITSGMMTLIPIALSATGTVKETVHGMALRGPGKTVPVRTMPVTTEKTVVMEKRDATGMIGILQTMTVGTVIAERKMIMNGNMRILHGIIPPIPTVFALG